MSVWEVGSNIFMLSREKEPTHVGRKILILQYTAVSTRLEGSCKEGFGRVWVSFWVDIRHA